MTGAEVARKILDENGLYNVAVEETPGHLSDHTIQPLRRFDYQQITIMDIQLLVQQLQRHEVQDAKIINLCAFVIR